MPEQQEAAKKGDTKAAPKKSGDKPFIQQCPLKDVFYLFADSKTKLLPLNEVPYVLRATGLTIYGHEEKTIKAEVEKIDGLGKPVTFQTLQNWLDENQKTYARSYEDAFDAIGTLCREGITGNKQTMIIAQLKNLVTRVGDTIRPETFDKILKAGDMPGAGLKTDTCSVEDFITFVQK
mmetsp:Transcript_25104/g.50899  ORF Transcript_25104/g.50899 Transcript_25104/m.50899 type:complete len:178 (-) Transcript_25104:201-734(-)